MQGKENGQKSSIHYVLHIEHGAHVDFSASSVKCVDIHHYACIKAVIMCLCGDPNNILYKYFKA